MGEIINFVAILKIIKIWHRTDVNGKLLLHKFYVVKDICWIFEMIITNFQSWHQHHHHQQTNLIKITDFLPKKEKQFK